MKPYDMLNHTLEAYGKMPDAMTSGLPPGPSLELVAFECTSRTLTRQDAEGLARQVREERRCGWLRLFSGLWSSQSDDFGDLETPPLAGEWKLDENSSEKLLYLDPEDGWRVWTCREGAATPESANLALRQKIYALEHPASKNVEFESAVKTLCFHVFWGAPEGYPSAFTRLFSRFAGFVTSSDRVHTLQSVRGENS